MVNFQNLKVVHVKKYFKEGLVEVENGKGKCPHILYVKPPTEGFIFHSFHFLVLWLLVFEICMVLSEHPAYHLRCA